jgi:ketosteroid isomerase-like protein
MVGGVSDENVAIVRSALEHFASTDEFLLELIAPDFAWDMSTFEGWPDGPVFEGVDGLREFVTLWREPYDDWSMTVEEVIDCGDGRVVALLRQSGKPHGSDAAVHLHYGLLHTLDDGRLRRIEAYASVDGALTAAGLRA